MTEPVQKKYDCVVWGGYGRGNTGDEWCLAPPLQRVRPEFGPAVAVLSCDPEYTARLFPEATVVPLALPRQQKKRGWNIFQKFGRRLSTSKESPVESEGLQCLRRARQLYLAGGGYLTDLWSMELVLLPLEFAVQTGLKVFTAPIGIGPFKNSTAANRVADALRGAEITVRDPVS